MIRKFSVLIALSFLFAGANAQVFVTPTGNGTMNGSSWANALSASQLRSAIHNASAGTSFWIAAGTYKPHASSQRLMEYFLRR